MCLDHNGSGERLSSVVCFRIRPSDDRLLLPFVFFFPFSLDATRGKTHVYPSCIIGSYLPMLPSGVYIYFRSLLDSDRGTGDRGRGGIVSSPDPSGHP